MIGDQKRGQQRERTMLWFYGTFSLAFKTDQREIGITDLVDKDLFTVIIADSSGAMAAAT
jgi:hypothetical protein